MMRRAILAGLVVCLGCSSDRADQGAVGDTVALSAFPAIPAIALPNGDESPSVTTPGGVALIGGGRVAVTSQESMELYVFDAAGKHLGTGAGKGAGPGQLQNVFGIASVGGDSIGVWDSAQRRLSIFGGDAKFVRTEVLDFRDTTPLARRVIGRFDDGRFVFLEQQFSGGPGEATTGAVIEQKRRLRAGSNDSAAALELPASHVVMTMRGRSSYSFGVPSNQL